MIHRPGPLTQRQTTRRRNRKNQKNEKKWEKKQKTKKPLPPLEKETKEHEENAAIKKDRNGGQTVLQVEKREVMDVEKKTKRKMKGGT